MIEMNMIEGVTIINSLRSATSRGVTGTIHKGN